MAKSIDDLINQLESSEPTTAPSKKSVEDVVSRLESGEVKAAPSQSVWDEYGQEAKKLLGKGVRGTELLARGMAQSVPSAVAGYTAAGPVGGMIGSVAIPFGDTLNSIINRVAGTNLRMPSEIISTNLAKAGLAEPKSPEARAVEAAGSGLGGAASELGSMYSLAKSTASPVLKEIGEAFTNKAGRQLATAPVAAGAGQYVSEETDSPFAGLLASLGIGATAGISPMRKVKGAPTHEDLVLESKNLYDKTKQSGVQFEPVKFADSMFKVGQDLRSEGYTAKAYPGIASVLEEMTNVEKRKDFTELQAMRKMIQNQQASTDPTTRKLASILKDDFDDYVLNAPDQHIITGSKEGLQNWKDARASYSKLKKSEIFDDMLQQAEFEGPNLYTQSGVENSLAKQLRQLAKNDRKMRTFTSEEQDAIRNAAKGGSTQNLLRFYGKFAPTGAVPGFFNAAASYAEPMIGLPFAFGATGARALSTAMRKNDVQNLGAQMRLGQQPEYTPLYNIEQGLIGEQPASKTYYLNNLMKEQK